jgi:hypothetical protein
VAAQYAAAIVEDLARLNVVADFPISHSSDHFESLLKYADEAVQRGLVDPPPPPLIPLL